jgi:hypothetical protein
LQRRDVTRYTREGGIRKLEIAGSEVASLLVPRSCDVWGELWTSELGKVVYYR